MDSLDELDSESRERVLLAEAYSTKQGVLGNLARARIRRELLNPPKLARDRNALYSRALEADGMTGGTDLHLHAHSHLDVSSFSPVVKNMIIEKLTKNLQAEGKDSGQILEVLSAEGLIGKPQLKTIDAKVSDAI